jgi:hypothetical protein
MMATVAQMRPLGVDWWILKAVVGKNSGYPVMLKNLDEDLWIEASQAAHSGDYAPMTQQIGTVMQPVEPAVQEGSSPAPEQAITAPDIEPEL